MTVKGVLLGILALIFLFGVFIVWEVWSSVGRTARGERLDRIRRSPQYAVEGFVNPLRVRSGNMEGGMREFFVGSKELRIPSEPLPVAKRSPDEFERSHVDLQVTWLGHSTLLVEMEGYRILTDPMWGNRASPSRLLGPSRFFQPPLALHELPPLDAVVLSHDHYDHLDKGSIKRLKETVPVFVVPLGNGAHLAGWGVPESKIVELDWWEEYSLGDLKLVCTPARHFSGRFLHDRNRALWSGWAFVGETRRAFFSGDSGMFPGFAGIGERLGPFDITMLDVGAYNTAWPDVHMGPEQAVQAHQLLKGNILLPVHWGTFNLSIHSWTAPMERVLRAAEELGVQVVSPRPGERVVAAAPAPVDRWWPEQPYKTAEELPIVSSQLH